MKLILNSRKKIIITLVVTVVVLCLLLLEHFQGGVVSHHLFARKDMPKISNWWGILTIPLLTWVLLTLMQKRQQKATDNPELIAKQQLRGFIGAFIFGIVMTILFYNAREFTNYFMLITFVLALFIPIYRPEFFLGYILSLTYGFGGVLPVLFGLILFTIYAIEYRIIRQGLLFVYNKIK